jgi:hypothetical protein
MRFVTAALTVAAVSASAAVAVASTPRLSDVQFIAANRCIGIESTKQFASPDADALRQLLKAQPGGRDGYIYDKADQAREDGERDASRGSADVNARLAAERDGICRALVSTTTASAPGGAHNMVQ